MRLFEPIFDQLEKVMAQVISLLYVTEVAVSSSYFNLPPSASFVIPSAVLLALDVGITFSAPQALQVSPSGQFVAIGYEGVGIVVATTDGKVLGKPIPAYGVTDGFAWCSDELILVRRFAEKGCIRNWCIYALHGSKVDEVAVDADIQKVLHWKVSPNGHYLAYTGIPKRGVTSSSLVVVDLHRKSTIIVKKPFAYTFASFDLFWSADSKLVYGIDGAQLWQLNLATGAIQRFPLIKFYAQPRHPGCHFELATDGSGLFLVSEYGGMEKPGKLSCFDIRTGARMLIAEGKFSGLIVRSTGVFVCKRLSFRQDYPLVEHEELFVGCLQQGKAVRFRTVVAGIARAGGTISCDLTRDGRRVVYIGSGVPLQSGDVRSLLAQAKPRAAAKKLVAAPH